MREAANSYLSAVFSSQRLECMCCADAASSADYTVCRRLIAAVQGRDIGAARRDRMP